MMTSLVPFSNGQDTTERQNAVAKKRRRKQNVEIDELGELVPFRRSDGKTLDKLSIVRLTTTIFKFHNLMNLVYGANGSNTQNILTLLIEQAMDGFLMVVDSDGVILYASDNMESFVSLNPRDVIGHSLHDLVQSEEDKEIVTTNLQPKGNEPSQYRDFCLELQNSSTSKSPHKALMQVSGHLKVASTTPASGSSDGGPSLLRTPQSTNKHGYRREEEDKEIDPRVLGFVAICRPISRCLSILELDAPNLTMHSRIGFDMRMISIDFRLRDVLGWEPEDFFGLSYKNYLYPKDTEDAKKMGEVLKFLQRTGYAVSAPFRIMSVSGDWAWMQAQFKMNYDKKTDKPLEYECLFKLIGEKESSRRYIELKRSLQGGYSSEPGQEMKHHQQYGVDVVQPEGPTACYDGLNLSNPPQDSQVPVDHTHNDHTQSQLSLSESVSPSGVSSFNPSSSASSPFNPSSTGSPINPSSTGSPINPSSTGSPINPSSTDSAINPSPTGFMVQPEQQEQFVSMDPSYAISEQNSDDYQAISQQQQQQQRTLPPPLPPQEWMEKQRKLQDQIQKQRTLLQDLLIEQQRHQMMLPRQPQGNVLEFNQELVPSNVLTPSSSSVNSGSFLSPTPSPSSHGGSSLAPSPPYTVDPTSVPLMTNGDQNGPNGTTGTFSLLGSVNLLSGGSVTADENLVFDDDVSSDIQELLEQFMQ